MSADGPLPTGAGTSLMPFVLPTEDHFSHGLPAASFLLALARICWALLQTQGVLHLRVSELDGDAVLRRNLCDHPLPLHGSGTRDARAVFLHGHFQAEEDRRLILVENGDNASAVDDGNLAIQHVRHIAGFAVDCPDAGRGDLVGKNLLFLFICKPLLREAGPIGAGAILGRWSKMQRV